MSEVNRTQLERFIHKHANQKRPVWIPVLMWEAMPWLLAAFFVTCAVNVFGAWLPWVVLAASVLGLLSFFG